MLLPIVDVSQTNSAAVAEDLSSTVRDLGRVGEVLLCDCDATILPAANDSIIQDLIRVSPCFVLGGIKDEDQVRDLLRGGAHRVVLDSFAPMELLSRLPHHRVLVSIQCVDGVVVTNGRGRDLARAPVEALQVLAPYCSGFLCTFSNSDGSSAKPDINLIKELSQATSLYLAVRSDDFSLDEIQALDKLRVDVAARANQDFHVEGFAGCLNFDDGPIPTVVQDQHGQTLMLGWSNYQTLKRSLLTGEAVYCSANGVDVESVGDYPFLGEQRHRLLRAAADYSRRSLVFRVTPYASPFERGRYSRYGKGDRDFSLSSLHDIILARQKDPHPGSYTSFLFERDDRIPRKLTEELYELLTANTRNEIAWEAADVMYFLLAYLVKKGVSLDEVMSELMGRER